MRRQEPRCGDPKNRTVVRPHPSAKGTYIGVAEAIILQGLVALEPWVQRRLNRRITKPLDLACLRAFKAEMEGRDVAPDVQAALDQLPDKAKVEALLGLHTA